MCNGLIKCHLPMLTDANREPLLQTLKEIQVRLSYFACSVFEGDDPESVVLLRSAMESIERVVERVALRQSGAGSSRTSVGSGV